MSVEISNNDEYKNWSESIFVKIQHAQTITSFKINTEMLSLYWEIGNSILEKQNQHGWGTKVIDLLAKDLIDNFPNNSGFSVRNLKYMRSFAGAYPNFPFVQVPLAQNDSEFVQVSLAQITWYHHISLLTKVKDPIERAYYIHETAKNEWSRDVMLLQIQNKLYERDGKALNNFEQTLPDYQSDLAKSKVKVEYAMRGLDKPLGVATYQLEQLVKDNIDEVID